jgi:hypothetical protein
MVLSIVFMGFVLMNVLNGLCWVRCGGGFCRLKNFVFFALGVVGLIWILWVWLGLYFALTF